MRDWEEGWGQVLPQGSGGVSSCGEMPWRAGLKLQDNGRMPVWELGALRSGG